MKKQKLRDILGGDKASFGIDMRCQNCKNFKPPYSICPATKVILNKNGAIKFCDAYLPINKRK